MASKTIELIRKDEVIRILKAARVKGSFENVIYERLNYIVEKVQKMRAVKVTMEKDDWNRINEKEPPIGQPLEIRAINPGSGECDEAYSGELIEGREATFFIGKKKWSPTESIVLTLEEMMKEPWMWRVADEEEDE